MERRKQHLFLGGIRLFFQEGSLERLAQMPSAQGWPGSSGCRGPEHGFPQRIEFICSSGVAWLSSTAPELGRLDIHRPSPSLSLGRKCEKTGPRSLP